MIQDKDTKHSFLEHPRISALGTFGLLFEAPGSFDIESQKRIWALAQQAAQWDEVREAVPGMTNLTLLFQGTPNDPEALEQRLLALWDSGIVLDQVGRTLDVPIIYGGKGGFHLNEVAEQTGLSVDEVVEIHSAPLYVVYAIGSHGGYCYLAGLDPRLFLPRRAKPLLSIPSGSLSIASSQTGVSASDGPSGWHTIGESDIRFFDPNRAQPSLLRPGDCIRFSVKEVRV